ncbi:Uncharacterised protein [Mycobacteroides abscessus subsp. massiliense]|nr:Uncharacterised protein [Mycobacteroides abscessus subsp. massiliense]
MKAFANWAWDIGAGILLALGLSNWPHLHALAYTLLAVGAVFWFLSWAT